MFSLRRAPFRRCLHTQATRSLHQAKPYRLGFTLAASITVASYTTWRWTRDQRIALDSVTVSENIKTPVLDGSSSETHHISASPSQNPEGSTESSTKSEAETEASDGASQGAYNPETGEINWDCPCLGGMAYGPCGPEFREAFSCFIYSEEEPKGINCVEKFQAMQTCFRAHPEVYADEIMDDDEDGKANEGATEGVTVGASSPEAASSSGTSQVEKPDSSVSARSTST
ncbi:hypothetical protein EV359DRAFT_72291 [Lentinula novae-zelandiae]|nr:hypothetical protein EV359DRAFT_72291 [Lentinula novae-zelandiae]